MQPIRPSDGDDNLSTAAEEPDVLIPRCLSRAGPPSEPGLSSAVGLGVSVFGADGSPTAIFLWNRLFPAGRVPDIQTTPRGVRARWICVC